MRFGLNFLVVRGYVENEYEFRRFGLSREQQISSFTCRHAEHREVSPAQSILAQQPSSIQT